MSDCEENAALKGDVVSRNELEELRREIADFRDKICAEIADLPLIRKDLAGFRSVEFLRSCPRALIFLSETSQILRWMSERERLNPALKGKSFSHRQMLKEALNENHPPWGSNAMVVKAVCEGLGFCRVGDRWVPEKEAPPLAQEALEKRRLEEQWLFELRHYLDQWEAMPTRKRPWLKNHFLLSEVLRVEDASSSSNGRRLNRCMQLLDYRRVGQHWEPIFEVWDLKAPDSSGNGAEHKAPSN